MSGGDRTASRRILGVDQIDDLGQALIALTRELWVLTDRLAVVEAVLTDSGIDMAKVDGYQPDAAMTEKLEAKRKALIGQVMSALRAEPQPA